MIQEIQLTPSQEINSWPFWRSTLQFHVSTSVGLIRKEKTKNILKRKESSGYIK